MSAEAAGEICNWSLLGLKGLSEGVCCCFIYHFARQATPKDSRRMASRWPSRIVTGTRTAALPSSQTTRKGPLLPPTGITWCTKVLALPWTGGELAGKCLHIAPCPTTSSSWPSCTSEAAERTLPVTAGRRPGVPLSACAELSSQVTLNCSNPTTIWLWFCPMIRNTCNKIRIKYHDGDL